jgi:hypothetical protein
VGLFQPAFAAQKPAVGTIAISTTKGKSNGLLNTRACNRREAARNHFQGIVRNRGCMWHRSHPKIRTWQP